MIPSRMSVQELKRLVIQLLVRQTMRMEDARVVAKVFTAMTLRDVGHHDIHDLPWLLGELKRRRCNPRPKIRIVKNHHAAVVMDADGAPGSLAAYRMTEQAIRKAEKYGIGIAVMRGSNHFVGSAAYTLMAAERGMLGIAMSNTESIMGAPGSKDKVIGNNPWGFAAPTGAGFPLLLDICNAYASFGKFWLYRKNKWEIPLEWGLDASGRNTASPSKVLDGGIPLPMAGHKGFGIAVLVELLTSVLSGGSITDEVRHPDGKGRGFSQAALVIDIGHFMSVPRFRERTKRMIRHLKKHPVRGGGKIELPGERSHRAKLRLMKTGIRLSPSLRTKLENWLRDTPLIHRAQR